MEHFKVLILGGGTGGVAAAARLCKKLDPQMVGLIEPSSEHFYQPAWTLVGAGLYSKQATSRPQEKFIPKGCTWIKESVKMIQPEEKSVFLNSGKTITYDFLIVATGLQLKWNSIHGARESLGQNGVCTIYEFEQADKVYEMLNRFQGGTAIFIMPPVPIKCAGAPQKIMYLAEEIFRNNGVRQKTRVIFASAGQVIFGVPEFAKSLNLVVQNRGIETLYGRKLIAVLDKEKIAVFERTIETKDSSGNSKKEISEERIPFDLLHVVPPMTAHDLISNSGLAFNDGPQKGWLKVNKETLQHMDYPNIFGIGDVTGVPNSKTGAAIRKQAPLVVQHLLSAMKGEELAQKYDGYSACPLITRKGRVILAEFGYDGKLLPSFPFDTTKERRTMWILKKYLLPVFYWWGLLRGRA